MTRKYKLKTKELLEELIAMECMRINTEHQDFEGRKKRVGRLWHKIATEVVEESDAKAAEKRELEADRVVLEDDSDEEDSDEEDSDGDEDEDDEEPPSEVPPRASAPLKVLWEGSVLLQSKGFFGGGKRYPIWVRITSERALEYWKCEGRPDEDEDPFRVLDLECVELEELEDDVSLKKSTRDCADAEERDHWKKPYIIELPNQPIQYKVVAPYGVGWRETADYSDTFDDGIPGPENGAVVDTYEDSVEDDGIEFVLVDDDDTEEEHGGWLPVCASDGSPILEKLPDRDFSKVLTQMIDDEQYEEYAQKDRVAAEAREKLEKKKQELEKRRQGQRKRQEKIQADKAKARASSAAWRPPHVRLPTSLHSACPLSSLHPRGTRARRLAGQNGRRSARRGPTRYWRWTRCSAACCRACCARTSASCGKR